MGLVDRILASFRSQPCQVCEAYRAHIAFLEDELRYRRFETEGVRLQLYKALRLEPVDHSPVERPHMEPVNTGRGGKSWPKLKAELEAKAKRKGPEDERTAYWAEKVAKMEAEAGLSNDSSSDPANHIAQDIHELAQ